MKRTKLRLVGTTIVIGGALFGLIISSALNIHNAEAAQLNFVNTGGDGVAETTSSSKDIDTVKQNILLKVYYSNLNTCYNSMRSPIPMTTELLASDYRYETRSGEGNYYFTSSAFNENYMLYPYGIYKDSRGNVVTHSSCVDMLSGWRSGHLWWKTSGTGILSYNSAASVPTYGGNNGEKIIEFLNDVGYDSSESNSSYADYECFYLSMNFSLAYSSWRQEYIDAGYSNMRADQNVTFETPDYCIVNKNKSYSATENQTVALFGEWTQDYISGASEVSGHLKNDSNVVLAYLGSGSSPYLPSWQAATRYWANDGLDYDYETRFLEISSTNYLSLYYNPGLGKNDTTDVSSVTPSFIRTEEMCNNSKSYGFWGCNYEKGAILGPKNWRYSLTEPSETSISFVTFQERLKYYFEHIQFDDDGGSPYFANVTVHEYSPKDVEFTKRANGVNDFIKYFLGDTSTYNGGKFTKAEQYVLYYTFLNEYWNVDVKYAEPANSGEYFKVDNWLVTNSSMAEYGSFVPVWIKPTTKEGDDVRSLAGNLHWYSGSSSSDFVQGDWRYIATLLNNINVESAFNDAEVSEPIIDPDLDPVVPDGGAAGSTSDMAKCFNNASSLGWILCPVLKFVGVAADGIWQEIADNWLVTDYEQYQASSSNGIYIAWGSIRNIANIVFAIMLFVVIMSQLTGIGISNYGIKKILPTLVMIIILVNISFLICQLLIDVSNVAGSSIEGITDFIRPKIPSSSGVGAGDVFRGTLASLFTAAGIAGVGYGGYLAVSMNGAAVLIPLLITILGVLISIVFAFMILAIRQAGILLCVIISPLAIICYALPNTKSLFDKWKKLFTSLLFIYPVCAACIYGGQVMSSLMLASDNTAFMYNLVAMLLQIVPIFFIPSLIKGSLALAGNIGAKVSQFGSGLRNRATGSLRRSEMVNRARTEAQGRAAQRNQALFNKMLGRKGIAGAIGKYGSRRLARQTQAYQKMQLEDEHAKNLLRGDPGKNLSSALLAQRRADEQKDVDSAMDALVYGNDLDTTDVHKIGDALEDAMIQYEQNPDDYQAMVRTRALVQLLMSKGDTGQSQALQRIRGHIDPTGNGGVTASAAMRSLGEYITNNDKWIGSIKAGDTGGFNFMNDLAMGNSIKAANTYNTMGTNKVTAGTIGSMGDSWYDGIDRALTDGAMDATTVSKFADMATKALTDPRTAHMIKGERVATLNRLREQAYNNDVQKWLSTNTGKTRADYEAQFGKFQKIENPGDELKITHRKINMPNGWRQATADDISRSNPGLNLTQGEWINDNGGTISRLNTEQILQAQEIQRRNANIDVDNMQ